MSFQPFVTDSLLYNSIPKAAIDEAINVLEKVSDVDGASSSETRIALRNVAISRLNKAIVELEYLNEEENETEGRGY